jgi:hypothetical protein
MAVNVYDLDPTCYDDRDDDRDYAAERAYDRAVIAHRRADAAEYRETGTHIDPMPTFAEFIGGVDDDTTDDMENAA